MSAQRLTNPRLEAPTKLSCHPVTLAVAVGVFMASAGCSNSDDDGHHQVANTSIPTSTATPSATSTPTSTATVGIPPGSDPVTEAFIRLIVANGPPYGDVNPDQVRRMLLIENDRPFCMFNLIRFRDHAVYPDGSDGDLTGREADARYDQAVPRSWNQSVPAWRSPPRWRKD